MKQNRIKDELLQTGTSVQAHIKVVLFYPDISKCKILHFEV